MLCDLFLWVAWIRKKTQTIMKRRLHAKRDKASKKQKIAEESIKLQEARNQLLAVENELFQAELELRQIQQTVEYKKIQIILQKDRIKTLEEGEQWSDLHIDLVLHVLSFLPVILMPENRIMEKQIEVERLVMRQLFGVFERDQTRTIYQLYKYVDFRLINNYLPVAPHCLRLMEVEGIWLYSWMDRGWSTTKFNPNLKVVMDIRLSEVLRYETNEKELFLEASKNLKGLFLGDETDISELTRLSTLSTLSIHDMNRASCPAVLCFNNLTSLTIGRVSNFVIFKEIMKHNSLESLNIMELGSDLYRESWNDNTSLKRFSVANSRGRGVHIYIPFWSPHLETVTLGPSIVVDPKSFSDNVPHEYCTINLTMGRAPIEFFSIVSRLSRLRKLAFSIGEESFTMVRLLTTLKHLRSLDVKIERELFLGSFICSEVREKTLIAVIEGIPDLSSFSFEDKRKYSKQFFDSIEQLRHQKPNLCIDVSKVTKRNDSFITSF